MKTDTLSVNDFTSKVKEITRQGVAEIIKFNDRWYKFRVSTFWYDVGYYNEMGMVFKLLQGEDSTNTTNLICSSEWMPNGSPLRKQGDMFFDYLEKIYVSHLVFKNDRLTNSLKNYISLIAKCSALEKLSNNVFVMVIDNIKYVFERNEKYNIERQFVLPFLEIKYTANNEMKTKKIDEYKKIDSIFSVLNAMYYLNKTEENELVEDEILNLFS